MYFTTSSAHCYLDSHAHPEGPVAVIATTRALQEPTSDILDSTPDENGLVYAEPQQCAPFPPDDPTLGSHHHSDVEYLPIVLGNRGHSSHSYGTPHANDNPNLPIFPSLSDAQRPSANAIDPPVVPSESSSTNDPGIFREEAS